MTAGARPLRDGAEQLLDLGWALLPLRSRGKLPRTKHGLKDASTERERVATWQKRHPDANIGAATGERSGFWVLDVDVHGEVDGLAALAELEQRCGPLPATVEQITGSGGRQLFFRYKTEIRNSAGRIAPGLDVRGEGGYVVVPPSVHPNGKAYQWAPGAAPWEREMAAAPAWLEDLARKKPDRGDAPGLPANSAYGPNLGAVESNRYGETALAGELAKLSGAREGGRNDALNRAAFSLGQLVAGGALSRARCEAALLAQAVGLGLDRREASATIASGLAAGAAQPRSVPARERDRRTAFASRANATPPAGGSAAPHPPQSAKGQRIADLGTSEGAAAGTLNLEWFDAVQASLETADFVEGLLTSCGMSVVFGEPGTWKTFFALDLALHVALGSPWFGRQVDVGGVVYVAAEGGYGMRNRVAAFRQHNGLDDAIVPFALALCQVNLLDPAADTERLIATVRQAAAKIEAPVALIVVDTLSRALAGGNENAPEDMGALVMNVDTIRQATGAHVMLVHHRGKDEARGLRGHSLLRGAIDTEIEIERDDVAKTATATVKKQRDLESVGAFTFRLEVVELGLNARGAPITSCVVAPAERSKPQPKAAKLTAAEGSALDHLRQAMSEQGKENTLPQAGMQPVTAMQREAVRKWFVMRGVVDAENPAKLNATERSKVRRLIEGLRHKGRIGVHGDWIWLL